MCLQVYTFDSSTSTVWSLRGVREVNTSIVRKPAYGKLSDEHISAVCKFTGSLSDEHYRLYANLQVYALDSL
jgi:hypothetical protein